MGDGKLYFNGDIVTMDPAIDAPEAVAVRDGRIARVGTRSACESALEYGFERYDLRGRALLPGFIDTHVHPLMMVYYDMNLDLSGADSIARLQEMVRAAADRTPPGAWVVGLRFDEQALSERRIPTRHDLDAACPNRPVVIIKHDGHMAVGNTPAIEACGVSGKTPDPVGGAIDREHGGYPAGAFREEAGLILKSGIPIPDPTAFVEGAKSTFARLASLGITSIGAVMQTSEEGPAGADGAIEVQMMQALLEHVPVSMYGLLVAGSMEPVAEAMAGELHAGEIGAPYRIGGVKVFADGTFGSHTAFMAEPYTDEPGTRGFLTMPEEEIYGRMEMAHLAGMQAAVHAIGDECVRTLLDMFDRLLSESPRRDHRHRIEHASQLSPELISRIARRGLVLSVEPLYIHSEKRWLGERLGGRTRWTYPFRSLLEAGVRLAGASDAPVESMDVLHALECCVTREGFEPGESITVEQALRMYTIDAAYAQFEETVKGSITPGKRADLIVLSESPLKVPPTELRGIEVEHAFRFGSS